MELKKRELKKSNKVLIAKHKISRRKGLEKKETKPHQSQKKEEIFLEVEVYEQGCPLCKNDVKGNDKYDFFCSNCNILFKRSHLNIIL